MTVFNLIVLFPLSGEALRALKEYEEKKTNKVRNKVTVLQVCALAALTGMRYREKALNSYE